MNTLPTETLRLACRVYLRHAYPRGPATASEVVRAYWEMPANADVHAYLPPAKLALGIGAVMHGRRPGFLLRLGSDGFPFVKMALQAFVEDGATEWVASVDTHDVWHITEQPEPEAWFALQAANRELKVRIEKDWEAAGLTTQNRLLRRPLALA